MDQEAEVDLDLRVALDLARVREVTVVQTAEVRNQAVAAVLAVAQRRRRKRVKRESNMQ